MPEILATMPAAWCAFAAASTVLLFVPRPIALAVVGYALTQACGRGAGDDRPKLRDRALLSPSMLQVGR